MPDALPVSATPATYESLPVKIQAVRWDGTANHAKEIIDWIHQHERNASYACDGGVARCSGADEDHHLIIRTLEGNMAAAPGWWIIMGTEGEFYPCKDSVFQRKYRELRIEDALAELQARPLAPQLHITSTPDTMDVGRRVAEQTMKMRGLSHG